MFNLKNQNQKTSSKGFTLIEILIVIGIIAILATIVIIAINPARQFAQARDTQRTSNVNAILNAIGQRIADNKGVFGGTLGGVTCPSLPAATTSDQIFDITTADGSGDINLSCLVPTYMSVLTFDPLTTTGTDTHYDLTIETIAEGGRITVSAPDTEIASPDISITR